VRTVSIEFNLRDAEIYEGLKIVSGSLSELRHKLSKTSISRPE